MRRARGARRQRQPRPLGASVERQLAELIPDGADSAPARTLNQISEVWSAAVGDAVAANARPVQLRPDGTLLVACANAAWASELELLGPELLARLAESLPGPAPKALKARPSAQDFT